MIKKYVKHCNEIPTSAMRIKFPFQEGGENFFIVINLVCIVIFQYGPGTLKPLLCNDIFYLLLDVQYNQLI